MRVVFCGGGTGGHVYPALTVANALRRLLEDTKRPLPPGEAQVTGGALSLSEVSRGASERNLATPGGRRTTSSGEPASQALSSPSPWTERSRGGDAASAASPRERLELLYIGISGKMDAGLAQRENMPFKAVTAGPLRTPTLLGTAGGLLKLLTGTAQAYAILTRFKPDVVFATGGYGSAGVGLAARVRRLPLLLFEPGPEAGLAVRLLARLADRIAVTIPPAYNAMPRSKTVILGYPVRPAFFEAKREAARDYFGLDPSLPVLLVSGASSGANSLNRAIAGRLADYLSFMQVMHLCGANDEAWLRIERAKLSEDLQQRYHLHAYLHDDMALALAAADLAVMRSGASVLGELPATRLPAILVPGEYEGWDQSNNARYLESEGAAIMLPQSRMDDLYKTVAIVIHDPTRLDAMRGALQDLARPSAANDLARVLLEMAGAKAPV